MPNEDVPHACRGRDGSGCGFGASRQVNYTHKRTGKTYYKRLCCQCNAGKRPASRSPSPQRRPPVQRAQNCFGGDASAVSHRQVGRGRASQGTSWTGSQHEFDNPTSEDATAYTTQRNGGSRKYHWWTTKQQKLLAVFGWLSCIRDATLLVNGKGKCISDQYHADECPGCCEDKGEEESKQVSQQADEGEGEAIEEDDETLVGPYKAPANWEVVPEETVANSMERGLQLQGFIRGRKVVHLFKHPDGWSEGMFTRRCIREGQPSDIYSIKYDDGTAFDQPCVRTTHGTGLGKTWCIIQPIQS